MIDLIMKEIKGGNMKEALETYLEAIKKDYLRDVHPPVTDGDVIKEQVRGEMIVKFFSGLTFEMGSKYIKVITSHGEASRSVHSFIVREDGPKFKKGDILKAATFKAPALNQARGNIFGTYHTSWTGADYLR
jgi:hypothetical protein